MVWVEALGFLEVGFRFLLGNLELYPGGTNFQIFRSIEKELPGGAIACTTASL